jgi:hypothetical protein
LKIQLTKTRDKTLNSRSEEGHTYTQYSNYSGSLNPGTSTKVLTAATARNRQLVGHNRMRLTFNRTPLTAKKPTAESTAATTKSRQLISREMAI